MGFFNSGPAVLKETVIYPKSDRPRDITWTSGKHLSASSGICLIEYHGVRPWMEEGPKKAGIYSRIISKLRNMLANEEVRQNVRSLV